MNEPTPARPQFTANAWRCNCGTINAAYVQNCLECAEPKHRGGVVTVEQAQAAGFTNAAPVTLRPFTSALKIK